MLKFGANITGFDLVNYFARNGDNILIGRFWGSEPLGLYSKAYQLLMLPITMLRNPITSVAMPAMSRLANDPERYRDYYLKLVGSIAFFSMPLGAIMFVCSDSLIYVLLGQKWMAASPIFRALAVAAFIQPVYTTAGNVFLSRGRGAEYMKAGTANAAVLCVCFVAGLPYGAYGVASTYAAANYITLAPVIWYSSKGTLISVGDVLAATAGAVAASGVGAVGCVVAYQASERSSHVGQIVVATTAGVVVYLLAWAAVPAGRSVLQRNLALVALVRRR